jgi:methyl-accepting chemotaxis protein
MSVLNKSNEVSSAIDEVAEAASAYGFQFRTEAETKVASSRLNLIVLAAVTGMVGLLLSFATAYSFIGPIRYAMAFSERIASGDFSQRVEINRRDEFGRLLTSLGAMQQALRAQGEHRLSESDKKERDLAVQIQRRESLEQEVSRFRVAIEQILHEVNDATTLLNTTARTLSNVAVEADQQIHQAATAAGETSQNVSAVASASEQLTGSFEAVVRRITDTNEIIANATKTAAGAVNTIEELSDATQHIEAVVALIYQIAEQTNLLALNATIEAARAGDAGRGFAVVASEVKTLATQTGKATQEISTKIFDVRSATLESVEAIKVISAVMSEIRVLTSGIAATVGEQSFSTAEIYNNVKNAASATEYVATNIRGTASSMNVTKLSASDLLLASERLAGQANALRGSVDQFLKNVAVG